MLHELRYYEIAAGQVDEYINHAGKVAVPFRGDDYGKLLGFWACEIGAVNCVFNLWEHESVATREVLRAKLQTQDVWRNDYLPHSQPLMRRQISRLLTPLADPRPPVAAGNLYEMRIFRTCPGKTRALAALLHDELPASLWGAAVATWTGNSGDVNEVVHLSVYPDTSPIAKILQVSAWRDFLKQHGALVEDIQSSLMTPAHFSPWR
jgi:hypothetical protein